MSYIRPRDTGLPHPADGCPQCAGVFAVVPFRAEACGQPSGVRCWYRCSRCLHSWQTAWHTPLPDDPHYYPDRHDGRKCSCGCGLLLQRPATSIGGAA